MRDVSNKPNTLRTAQASAVLRCSRGTIRAIKSGKVPKADPLVVGRVAGIQAAKNTSSVIPYCHQVPLDFVRVEYELGQNTIRIVAEAKAVWKTGVEMEALTAATVAALTVYDMLKIIDDTMQISDVKLLDKKGGKSDFGGSRGLSKLRAAVIVLSDKATRGEREETSGKAIVKRLQSLGLRNIAYRILPDEALLIEKELLKQCDVNKISLLFTTGGTGLSTRDVTPDATKRILDRELVGVSDLLRSFGQERNRFAMLGRGVAGVRGNTVIVNLPGALSAVNESLDVLLPWLFHAFPMLKGKGHQPASAE